MAQASIDVVELQRKLAKERTRIVEWSDAKIKAAKQAKEQHLLNIDRHAGTVRELTEQQIFYDSEAQELQKRLVQESAIIQQLQAQVSEARSAESALPAELDQLQQNLQQEFSRVQHREAELAASLAVQQSDLKTLQDSVALYESRLGLRFEQPQGGQDELRVIFTNIDEADPSREFFFGVLIKDDTIFDVRTCQPPVEQLPECVRELNETSNFSGFARKMRRAFKEVAGH